MLLAYLTAAALGTALVRARYIGTSGGGAFVALNLVLATTVVTSIVLAGAGSVVGAWAAFVVTIPFMAFVLPYLLGVALIRAGAGNSLARASSRTT